MTSTKRKCLFFGILFSVLAIGFVVLFLLNFIKTLDIWLCAVYVGYFLGIALIYNGAYNREKVQMRSARTSMTIGSLLVAVTMALLIYGLVTGLIVIW